MLSAIALAATLLIGGCGTITDNPCDDGKPVAPTHYSDKSGDKSFPQLPDMEYYWEVK